jgi:hypothetical protein
MKKVVSFSGGRTSAYLCSVMIDTFGHENVDFIFMDTGAEHPKTYDFVRSVNKELGLNLICLRGRFNQPLGKGLEFDIVRVEDLKTDLNAFAGEVGKYGVPYIGGMHCTSRMKLLTFQKHCDKEYGKGNYETWLGIRADEPARLVGDKNYKSIKKNLGLSDKSILDMFRTFSCNGSQDLYSRHFVSGEDLEKDIFKKLNSHLLKKRDEDNVRYLAEIDENDKRDILDWWGDQSFDLGIDEWLGNCVFCPKKSNLKLAAAQRDEPALYAQWLNMLYSDSVRLDHNTGHWSKMYRGKQSLESLIATFDGSTGAEIKRRIRGGKMLDTNSCSESCEVFN